MKKNFKKLAVLAMAAAMGLTALSGCGNSKEDSDTLVMGTNAAFPPFEFVTENGLEGKFDGVDIAIAQRIAKDMNKQLKIEDMEFEGLVASVSSGKVDMVIAGMTANDEKRQSVDFSDTYYTAMQTIVVAPDNTTINSAEDLKNASKVGVVLGYTGDSYVTDTLKLPEDKILRVSRGIDAVQDVKNGRLDAVVIDSATGKALAEKNGLKTVDDETAFEKEEYAIAVKKGNTELLEAINKTLQEMKANNEIEELVQKYNSGE